MHFINKFYYTTLKYDLVNKFNYKNTIKLPRFKKIILNLSLKATNLKQLSASLLAFELIVNQKGCLTQSKKPNTLTKTSKSNVTNCKLILQNYNLFMIVEKIIFEIFPKLKNLNEHNNNDYEIKKTTFAYKLKNVFTFSELESYYYYFNNLSKVNISIILKSNHKKELIFIFKSFQFPF